MKTLEPLTLLYRRDPSAGVPKLTVERGSLPQTEVEALADEMAGRYDQLSRKPDGAAVTLRGRTYLLQVLGRETRMPELQLRQGGSENGRPEPFRLAPPTGWTDGFLAALEPLVRQAPDPRDPHAPARAALSFTLEELRTLGRVSPDWLALLLTAGYLHFRQECCQEQDPARGNFYALALGELERLLEKRGATDPALRDDDPLTGPAQSEPDGTGALGWLKRSFHRLFPGPS